MVTEPKSKFQPFTTKSWSGSKLVIVRCNIGSLAAVNQTIDNNDQLLPHILIILSLRWRWHLELVLTGK
jgi:hypothetical protein